MACAPGWVLFLSLLVVPTAYKPVKAVLIVLTVLIIGAQIVLSHRVRLHTSVRVWTYVFVAAGAFFVAEGLVNHAPGVQQLAPLYAAWPIVYLIFVEGTADPRVLKSLETVLLVSAFVIFGYALVFILAQARLLPSFLLLPLSLDARIGFYPGFIQFSLNSLASMLFLIPYLMAAVVIRPPHRGRAAQVVLWAAMLIGIGVISVSLRRGIMLAVFLSPLFIAALAAALPRQQRVEAFRALGVLVGVLCVLLVVAALFAHFRYHWTPDNMLAFFRQGYEFGTSREPGAVARSQQAGALIDAWSRNPIFGAGAGAGGASYVRDPAQPWAYELSYLALLYQTGLAGLLLYAGGMVWIFWNGIQMIRSGHPLALRLLPVLIGVAAFLVGNATNPYLAKFDYAWVIFLPVAYINLWLLNPDRESARPEHGGPFGERIPGSH